MSVAEFEIGDKVTYYNGKKYFNVNVMGLVFDPVENMVEYKLVYRKRDNSDPYIGPSFFRTNGKKIKESRYFYKGQ